MRIVRFGLGAGLLSLSLGCGDEAGTGSLRVKLSAEETITAGLEVGAEEENTRDYAVRYTKFLAVIGRIKLARTDSGGEPQRRFVVHRRHEDRRCAGGRPGQLRPLPAGQWDQFGFETTGAAPGAKVLPGVSPQDAQVMIDQGLTYWIEGTVEPPEKPVSFSFQIPVSTVFSNCESDGEPGVAVGEGGASTATVTLHGDHLWFDSLPTGTEMTVMRRAAWLVQADRDGDGRVVTADLAAASRRPRRSRARSATT